MSLLPRTCLLLTLLVGACTIYTGDDDDGDGYLIEPGNDASSPWPDGSILPFEDAGIPDDWYTDAGHPIGDDGGQPIGDDAGHPFECWTIADEATCVITQGCEPLYRGVDCSCSAAGCECDHWDFRSCE